MKRGWKVTRKMCLISVLSVLVFAPAAFAETTLLAKGAIKVHVNEDGKDADKKLISEVYKEATKHPCFIKAEAEGRNLEIKMKIGMIIGEDNIFTSVELFSEECN